MASWEWSPEWLYRSYVSQAKFTFFLERNATQAKIRPEINAISIWEVLLGIIQFFILAAAEMQTRYVTAAFGMCCFTIWVGASNFTRMVALVDDNLKRNQDKREHAVQTDSLFLAYQQLRELSDSVNSAWQTFCFICIFDIVMWLSTDLDAALTINDVFAKIDIFYCLVYMGVSLALSAESFRQVFVVVNYLFLHIKYV